MNSEMAEKVLNGPFLNCSVSPNLVENEYRNGFSIHYKEHNLLFMLKALNLDLDFD